MKAPELSTLCYIEKDGKYLMLHRVVKDKDVNKGKWIGVGGHFEEGESPEECVLREVKEETGYTLTSFQYRGQLTFICGDEMEYISVFTADGFTGEPIACDEGVLEWIPKEEIRKLNLWEGDKLFLQLLSEDHPFFSMKLVYSEDGELRQVAVDGKPLEFFDVIDENGEKTGKVKERSLAHREGTLHATVHIWVRRKRQDGSFDLLLQKRSSTKDSYAGCFDISAAGHVDAGEPATDHYRQAALRELSEELGIRAEAEQLHYMGKRRVHHISGKDHSFIDEELSYVFIYEEPVNESELNLQVSEVEAVCWTEYRELRKAVAVNSIKHCIYMEELDMLQEASGEEETGQKAEASKHDIPIQETASEEEKRKEVRIRTATKADAPALLNIYAPYVEQTAITFEYEVPSVEEFAGRIEHILEKYPYLVAEAEGEIVGYAYAGTFKARAAYDWSVETTIYVNQKKKRMGIGGKLYAALEEALRAQHILNLNACIGYPQKEDEYLTKDSEKFHQKLGYRLAGTFHDSGYKFGRWYDMIWVEKMLGEHTESPASVIPFSETEWAASHR